VEWRAIDQLSLNKPGVLELEGIVAGTYLEATAIITVLEEAIAEPLLEAYEKLAIPNAHNIRGNITLPQQLDASEENVTISWSSSKSNVINAETSGAGGLVPAGVVTRGASDEQVTLTATLQWNGQSLTKTFNLTVKAAPQLEEYSGYIYTYF